MSRPLLRIFGIELSQVNGFFETKLSALHGWHNCNVFVRPKRVVTLDKFNSGADEDTLVPSTERGSARIDDLKQICYARSLRNFNQMRRCACELFQIGKELHLDLHRQSRRLSSRCRDQFFSENADTWQIPIPLHIVESVTHHEFVRDFEADIIRLDRSQAWFRF